MSNSNENRVELIVNCHADSRFVLFTTQTAAKSPQLQVLLSS